MTLELSNVANLPITIYYGMKIGQLSFMQLSEPTSTPYGTGTLAPADESLIQVLVGGGTVVPVPADRLAPGLPAVEAEQLSDGTPLRLGTGRAVFPDDGGSAEELLKAAEASLRGATE